MSFHDLYPPVPSFNVIAKRASALGKHTADSSNERGKLLVF